MSYEPPDKWIFDHGTVDLNVRRFLPVHGPPVPLTVRDVDVLRYLAQVPERLVGREELLREVWGSPADVDGRMVESAIRRLRVKIERDPTDARILVEVYGEGYRLAIPSSHPSITPTAPVPRPRTPLVGREVVLHRVAEELARTGFVVLTGGAGVGKTRIALEVAHRTEPSSYVPLTGVRTLDEVRHVVASALGAAPGDDPDEALVTLGAGRLLVLDDFDAEGGGDWVAHELRAPGLRVVATRPTPFGVPEEVAIEVGPLDPEVASSLYALRAEAAGRRPSPGEQADVDRLVRRLGSIPLALELAAAWAPLLDPAAVAAAIDDAAGPECEPLRAAVRGAWRLLTVEHQDVLLGCSVFPSVFDPTWVSSVAEAPARVPGAIPAVRRRGLLVAAGKRLLLPSAVREFLVEERARRGPDPLLERFARWCAEESERLTEAFVDPAEPRELLVELGTVVSSSHAVTDPDALARVVVALGPALDAAGWSTVHRACLERALAAGPGAAWDGVLAQRSASVSIALGDIEAAERSLARAEAGRVDDDVLRAAIALDRAGVSGVRGEGEGVVRWTAHAAEVLRTKRGLDPQRAGPLWLAIGANRYAGRDPAGTEEAYLQAADCARAAGSHRRAAAAFTRLASLAIEQGDVGLAAARVGEAESELRVLGLRAASALLRVRGALAELRGDYRLAEAEWREVAKLAGAHGEGWIEHEARLALGRAAIRRGELGEARAPLEAAAAFAEGRWTAGWVEATALLALVDAQDDRPDAVRAAQEALRKLGATEAVAFLAGELPAPTGLPLTARLRWTLIR